MEPARFMPGHCPLCGDPYMEVIQTAQGRTAARKGTGVFSEVRPGDGVAESNYTERYLLLSDMSITRVSHCTKHQPNEAEVALIFELTRRFAIHQLEQQGSDMTMLAKWRTFAILEIGFDEAEIMDKKAKREAALLAVAG